MVRRRKKNEGDLWWKFSQAIETFNHIRCQLLETSQFFVIDESMSAWRPRTTDVGGLPNISFVARKPESLGTEFKCVACPIIGCMTALEIQRGKNVMKHQRYNASVGATAGCTLRLCDIGNKKGIKGDAWFGSVRTEINMKLKEREGIFQILEEFILFYQQLHQTILLSLLLDTDTVSFLRAREILPPFFTKVGNTTTRLIHLSVLQI